jgi:hypothetical protein
MPHNAKQSPSWDSIARAKVDQRYKALQFFAMSALTSSHFPHFDVQSLTFFP